MKADDVLAASGDGTANTTVLRFTLELVSASNAVPIGWCGQYVRMRPVGAAAYYFFSKVPGTTVANPAAAADGGAGPTRGEYLADGECSDFLVPYANDGEAVYLVRLGSAGGASLYVAKASGQPLNNTLNGR
jgi:hypothetical protein